MNPEDELGTADDTDCADREEDGKTNLSTTTRMHRKPVSFGTYNHPSHPCHPRLTYLPFLR
jgi:hypothetical protein